MNNHCYLGSTLVLRITCFVGVALPMNAAGARAADSMTVSPARIPIGLAYAADGVNTSIFRVNAVVTADNRQFVAYYAADASVVVGERDLPGDKWDLAVQSFKGNIKDAHNDVVLGVSSDGLLHISYNHHDNPLHYRVSAKPYDIHSFGDARPMTGQNETSVTYPQFISAPDGTLYFFYRDGASGNGSLLLNRYDVASKSWQVVQHPLIDGESKRNPYWSRPSIGADGAIYVGWCWRDTPNAQTNHDICFTCSKDGGRTWLRSDGKPQQVPITAENAEVIDPVAKGSNLINQCSSAVDAQGRCHLVEYFNDAGGIPQYYDEWFDCHTWHKSQVSHRTMKFSLSGGGSLAIPISRPEVAITPQGMACIITRDAEVGGGIRLYEALAPYQDWKSIAATHADLGNWEPTYDLSRFRDAGILSLFVLPVHQGNHEATTNFGPQEAAIIEFPLK
jgi:hypothetical protein